MMIPLAKTFIASFIGVAMILFGREAGAQTTLIKKTIDKIESNKNFSYRHTNKIKDFFTTDTSTQQTESFILKAPEEKELGYLYRTEKFNKAGDLIGTELYNGKNRITLNPSDST